MRLSRSFCKTQKEISSEAKVSSHKLMIRTGMIQQLSSGIYSYLPFALRSLRKIENIIRDQLNQCGCEEVLMPSVLPAELWKRSNRWALYGDLLLQAEDRRGNQYCIGPTHEEVITDMVKRELRSWKQLPLNLYQIQGKFRDEYRPRFGLMRAREFIMKDAYSFDVDEEAARKSYELMYEAYQKIFLRCGLKFRAVDANSGDIGGDMSHEFQILAETGEDLILDCTSCEYSANIEKAITKKNKGTNSKRNNSAKTEIIDTPGKKTVEEVAEFLNADKSTILKSLIYQTSSAEEKAGHVMVIIAGDRDVNEVKLQAYMGADRVNLAADSAVMEIMGTSVGSIGPVGIFNKMKIIADDSVSEDSEWICGANSDGKHIKGAVSGRDFQSHAIADVGYAKSKDSCPKCESGVLEEFRGIEVGHVFYLGTKYSKALDCKFIDAKGKIQLAVMGCYGIGVGRTMAAAIEQNHDESGIKWPVAIAPWEVIVLPLQTKSEEVKSTSETIYSELLEAGIETVIDDRSDRPGFKFADADLIGYPVQIIVGEKNVLKKCVEVKFRLSGERKTVSLSEVSDHVCKWIMKHK